MANVINKTTLQYLKSVNTPDYPTADWIINPSLPACESKYWKIVGETVQEMNQAEKDAVDAAELEAAKKLKIGNIKQNTINLIAGGFEYDGVNYGSTLTDQMNWNTLLGLKNRVNYPLENVVKDVDGNYVTVQNQNTMEDIVLTGMTMVNTHRASHKVLKDQVNACTTIAEVEAIEDNRT